MRKIKRNLNAYTMVVYLNASSTIKSNLGIAIRENGITETQFRVLDVLYFLGKMNINDLMKKMLATSGNITFVLKSMESKGYINKKQCMKDKRKSYIEITEKGENLFEKILPEHLKEVDKLFSIYTDEEKKTLINLLKKFKKYTMED